MVMMVIRFPKPRNPARHEHTKPTSYLEAFLTSYELSKHERVAFGACRPHHNVRGQVPLALARPAGLGQDRPHLPEREGPGDHAEAEAGAGGGTGHGCRPPPGGRPDGPTPAPSQPH